MKRVFVQQAWLASSLLAAWVLMSVPVSLLAGDLPLIWLTIAAVVCFLPGSLVLALQPLWVSSGAAGYGALSGSVLRMMFVAAAMLGVAIIRPGVSLVVFGSELSAFYLVALVVETVMVVRQVECAASRRV